MERRTSSYIQLIKPGITLSNTISGLAGFFLAAGVVSFQFSAFLGVLLGISLIVASACVVNNIIDRDIDSRMKRTAKRDIARGAIHVRNAILFATILGLIGFTVLLLLTNIVTFTLGVIAYVWYVIIYGIAKRKTPASTIIGGVAGALPPMAGYVALTGSIDGTAIVLFLILFFWQLPHFYAIAIFRKADYKAARLPIWSVRYGTKSAKQHILISVILYALTVPLLSFIGPAGATYFIISTLLSLWWVYEGVSTYRTTDDVGWAKSMFRISLVVLLTICVLIASGSYLP